VSEQTEVRQPDLRTDRPALPGALPFRERRRPRRADAGQRLRRTHGGWTFHTLLRYGVQPLLVGADLAAWAGAAFASGGVVGSELVLLALVLLLFSSAELYRSRLSLSVLDDLPALVGRTLVAAALTTAVALLVDEDLVSKALLGTAALMAVLVLTLRAAAYAVVRRTRAWGWVAHPTLLLGAGRVAGQIATLLLEHPSYGLKPVGMLDSDPLLAEDERPVPLLGGEDSLASVIVEFGVRDVIVAFGSGPESQMVDIIRTCDRLDADIFFVPRLFELHHTSKDMDQIWGLPLVRLRSAAFRRLSWQVKRALDVLLSGIALILLAPVLVVLAVAVRMDGGKDILFKQERVGLDGRAFPLLKFRSMRPVDETESQTNWNIAQDDRLTAVGRFIRSTSLDELPQLWNILRGDMTIVGPRPERPYFVSTFSQTFPRYTARHRVPAGLTGWAQVHGLRGDTSIEERARFDNYYIENWSLWADAKIILRTVSAVLRRAGG
jgi:exopolysaccharide biosynthesis polyprenyl glycosylphosphotransferase